MRNTDTITLSPGGRFYAESDKDVSVRIPDTILKSLAFIGEVAGQDELGNAYGDVHGTGFFVQVPSQRFPATRFVYLVTAKHVSDFVEDKEIYITVNNKSGGITQLKALGKHWFTHPSDSSADIALIQVGFHDDVDILAARCNDFVTAGDIESGQIAIGDEVSIVGLFSPAPGTKRNMPIARHGNIAMFPEGQIQTELGFADVYLVEARSIGGISGSPVFARPPMRYGIEMPEGSTAYFDSIGSFRLLGVMHGHWDIREDEINNPKFEHDRKHGVNLGIGMVVPAIKILETLNQPELARLRDVADEDMGKKLGNVPGMD